MKKFGMIAGALILVAAIAYPVFAWGPGWGGMHGGMGYGGYGPGYYSGGSGNAPISQQQAAQLDQLRQQYYNDTTALRNDIWNKSRELGDQLNAANPDRTRIQALQKELNDLRGKMAQKQLDFQLEAKKIAPNRETAQGYGYGYGPGMGYGYHMGRFGGGYCWN